MATAPATPTQLVTETVQSLVDAANNDYDGLIAEGKTPEEARAILEGKLALGVAKLTKQIVDAVAGTAP